MLKNFGSRRKFPQKDRTGRERRGAKDADPDEIILFIKIGPVISFFGGENVAMQVKAST